MVCDYPNPLCDFFMLWQLALLIGYSGKHGDIRYWRVWGSPSIVPVTNILFFCTASSSLIFYVTVSHMCMTPYCCGFLVFFFFCLFVCFVFFFVRRVYDFGLFWRFSKKSPKSIPPILKPSEGQLNTEIKNKIYQHFRNSSDIFCSGFCTHSKISTWRRKKIHLLAKMLQVMYIMYTVPDSWHFPHWICK
jgi:hypothetical protein